MEVKAWAMEIQRWSMEVFNAIAISYSQRCICRFPLHPLVIIHDSLFPFYFISGEGFVTGLFCIYMQCLKVGRLKTGSSCVQVPPAVCTRSAEFLQTLYYRLCLRSTEYVHTDGRRCAYKWMECIIIHHDCIFMQNRGSENALYGTMILFG